MNIYDTKVITCTKCKKAIGEIEFDSMIIQPLCGQCSNPLTQGDKILYTASFYQNSPRMIIPQAS